MTERNIPTLHRIVGALPKMAVTWRVGAIVYASHRCFAGPIFISVVEAVLTIADLDARLSAFFKETTTQRQTTFSPKQTFLDWLSMLSMCLLLK